MIEKWKPNGFITTKVINEASEKSGYIDEQLYEYLGITEIESIALFMDGCLPEWMEDHNNKVSDMFKVYEILFHLAANDILVFSEWDSHNKNYGKYFSPAVLCNDTFYYSGGDAEEIDLSEVLHLEDVYNKFGEDGVVAWVSRKRGGLEPLKELQSEQYCKAVEYLKEKPIKVEDVLPDNII